MDDIFVAEYETNLPGEREIEFVLKKQSNMRGSGNR
jgi:hypothetical protein